MARKRLYHLAVAALLSIATPLGISGAPAAADDGAEATVPLDRLLRLPGGVDYRVETRGGYTRSEWRSRFTKRIRERDEAERALETSQEELEKIAGKSSAWSLAAPGTSGTDNSGDPLNFRLDQTIRRQRRELKEAEGKLEELKVEANLAEVPKAWREPAPETARDGRDEDDDW